MRLARILGAAVVLLAFLGLYASNTACLLAFGCCFLFCVGFLGLALCVMAGQVTPAELDEANGLRHPDDLEGKN